MNYTALFSESYKGKRVLVTGHTGFKGSWLICWLNYLQATLKGYALAPENENDLYNWIGGDGLCDSVIADIRDLPKLRDTVISFQPEIIFHLAAQPLVRPSYESPLYTFEVNVTGTANLLEAVRELKGKCVVVIITTDKVYENNESGQAYKESDKLGGYDPYSASKAAAEIVVSSYRNSFFNPGAFSNHQKAIASVRAGNVIGGGDRSKDRIIPDIIRAIEVNEPVVVRNPAAVRPWQFVLEPLGGYLLVGARLDKDPVKYAEAWNFGPYSNDTLTVKQVVEKALEVLGKGSYTTPAQLNQPHEAGLLNLDIEKAITVLGWEPLLNAGQAIANTMEWYNRANKGNALDITLGQIKGFMDEI